MNRYFGFKPLFLSLVALRSVVALLLDNNPDKSASAKTLYALLFVGTGSTRLTLQAMPLLPIGGEIQARAIKKGS